MNTNPILSYINVGKGSDISILELGQGVAKVAGFQGRIITDPSNPDGRLRKLIKEGRLAKMGWRAQNDLEDGIAETYQWYLANLKKPRSC